MSPILRLMPRLSVFAELERFVDVYAADYPAEHRKAAEQHYGNNYIHFYIVALAITSPLSI